MHLSNGTTIQEDLDEKSRLSGIAGKGLINGMNLKARGIDLCSSETLHL